MTKLSIIVASYNSGKTIQKALESILMQTFQEWECIIVDGVSMDNTLEIIKQYVLKDNRFRYVSEPDNGIYDAFNKGWMMARGEWIHYLGSDDYLLPDGLNKLIENCNNSDIVYGNTILNFGNYKRKQFSRRYTCLNKYMCCCHQSLIIKRNLIKIHGGFDIKYKLCADFNLIQKAYLYGASFKQINVFVSIYSVMGASSDNYSGIFELYKICKENRSTRIAEIILIYKLIKCLKNKLVHSLYRKL